MKKMIINKKNRKNKIWLMWDNIFILFRKHAPETMCFVALETRMSENEICWMNKIISCVIYLHKRYNSFDMLIRDYQFVCLENIKINMHC